MHQKREKKKRKNPPQLLFPDDVTNQALNHRSLTILVSAVAGATLHQDNAMIYTGIVVTSGLIDFHAHDK